jgi:GT2 family glycosyltransferase
MPALSVVIPTHRRAAILARCLEHLEAQTVADMMEVIVVSDEPDDETVALMAKRQWRIAVRFLVIEKCQQGKARNTGVQEVQSPLTLFIGDDIFLLPSACEEHIRAHLTPDTAVLGFTTWDPVLPQTPVMLWLERSGWQFGYRLIGNYAHAFLPRDMQHQFSYTSNISLPTDIARAQSFREDVTLYGWEDIEWGMRLRDGGVRILYAPNAKAFHHHPVTLEESLERMRVLGHSARRMEELVPGFDRVPTGAKLWAYKCAALLPTMAGKHRRAFLAGLTEISD